MRSYRATSGSCLADLSTSAARHGPGGNHLGKSPLLLTFQCSGAISRSDLILNHTLRARTSDQQAAQRVERMGLWVMSMWRTNSAMGMDMRRRACECFAAMDQPFGVSAVTGSRLGVLRSSRGPSPCKEYRAAAVSINGARACPATPGR